MKFFNEDLYRFIKFGLVGVINTITNWVIFIILNKLGLYYILANIIAYSLSTLNSYIWNSKWVFNHNGENIKETTIKFIILNFIGLILNTTILYILVDIVGLYKIISLIITTLIVMILNYFINKLWVFKK